MVTERNEGRRTSDGHCDNHETNTADLSTIKGTLKIAQWVIGLGMVLLVAMMQIAIGKLEAIQTFLNTSRESIVRLEAGLTHLSNRVDAIEKEHEHLTPHK